MRFTKEYSKLSKPVFTTIRKNTQMYQPGCVTKVRSPKQIFIATVLARAPIKKSEITEELARADADCSRTELIAMLEHWYGPDFDDFVLLTMRKEA